MTVPNPPQDPTATGAGTGVLHPSAPARDCAAHTPSVTREHDDIDDRARQVAKDVLAGKADETTGRHEIAELLYRSRIAYQTAGALDRIPFQTCQDLADRLNALLLRKVIGGPEESSRLQMSRLVDASASGWARQLLRAAVRSEMRNLNVATSKWESPVDPTYSAADPEAFADNDRHGSASVYQRRAAGAFSSQHSALATESEVLERISLDDQERLERVGDWAAVRSRNVRGASRTSMQATAIITALHLPRPLRPHYSVRPSLLEAFEADESLGWASAATLLELLGGDVPANLPEVHPDLVAVWDDYSIEHLYELVHKDRQYATCLMRWALMDWPRLPRPAQRELMTIVRAAMSSTHKGAMTRWRDIAGGLVESFVALEFEAISDFDVVDETYKAERITGHLLARQAAAERLAQAAAFDGAPLGRTPAAVHRSMVRIVEPRLREAVGTPEAIEPELVEANR